MTMLICTWNLPSLGVRTFVLRGRKHHTDGPGYPDTLGQLLQVHALDPTVCYTSLRRSTPVC